MLPLANIFLVDYNVDSDLTLTKRTVALAVVAIFAALPLVWFTVDGEAGDKLLRLTSSAPQSQVLQR